MKVRELVDGMNLQIRGDDQVEVTGIAYHSRSVEPGNLFVAIDGHRTEGTRFIDEALARGALAVAGAPSLEMAKARPRPVVLIYTDAPRRFLAEAARKFYRYPDRQLTLVGITGTNGKTTTAYLVKSILDAADRPSGLVGTIRHFDGDRWIPAAYTTPESLDLTRLFSAMVGNECRACVLEVSSHALALDRVFGLGFAAAAFTNLTQDHLDFHKNLEDYGAAKQKLFTNLPDTSCAVINQDDRFGAEISSRAKKIYYSLKHTADLTGRITNLGSEGTRLTVLFPEFELSLASPLVGRHNAYNIIAAAGVAYGLGLSPAAIQQGIARLPAVPGRLERVGRNVYVDYAHTPDALKNLIEAAREFTTGRVIVVFGCGGDRDRAKRPLMGARATALADFVIMTSDNPRSENPDAIIDEIRRGAVRANFEIVPDRTEAIVRALALAGISDVVLIAGKGHEEYQIIGETKIPFSDRAVVEKRGVVKGAPLGRGTT